MKLKMVCGNPTLERELAAQALGIQLLSPGKILGKSDSAGWGAQMRAPRAASVRAAAEEAGTNPAARKEETRLLVCEDLALHPLASRADACLFFDGEGDFFERWQGERLECLLSRLRPGRPTLAVEHASAAALEMLASIQVACVGLPHCGISACAKQNSGQAGEVLVLPEAERGFPEATAAAEILLKRARLKPVRLEKPLLSGYVSPELPPVAICLDRRPRFGAEILRLAACGTICVGPRNWEAQIAIFPELACDPLREAALAGAFAARLCADAEERKLHAARARRRLEADFLPFAWERRVREALGDKDAAEHISAGFMNT